MQIKMKIPGIMRFDNVGAIFMSNNVTTTSRTKQVDIRFEYVNKYVDNGIIRIIFVK